MGNTLWGMEITADQLLTAFGDTLYMVAISLVFSALIGLPLGILLVITRKGHILENKWVFNVLNPIINILRSVPFIILLVAVIPLTRMIVGSAIGMNAAIVPLIFCGSLYCPACGELPVGSGQRDHRGNSGDGGDDMANHLSLFDSRGT